MIFMREKGKVRDLGIKNHCCSDPKQTKKKVRRGESYSYNKYQWEFIKPSHQVHGLSGEFLTSYFISGLREPVKLRLLFRRPESVIEAMKLIRLEEEKANVIKKAQKLNYNRTNNNSHTSITTKSSSSYGRGDSKNEASSGPSSAIPIKKLITPRNKRKEG